MSWQNTVELNSEIVISTASENEPHSMVAMSKGFIDGKILFGLCNKNRTFQNLVQNPKICITSRKNGEYYRISGTVEIAEDKEILEKLLSLCSPPMPILAVLIKVDEVFDLDKNEKIF